MKNKLFWPIIIVAIVIMAESVLLLSGNQLKTTKTEVVTDIVPTEEVKNVEAVSFEWMYEEGKATLAMTANKKIAVDAIDLYIGYKDVTVNSVKNLNELPKPSFSKISSENSLVVMNYLINEAEGLIMMPGQIIQVTELDLKVNSEDVGELTIDSKTQVVENGTAKVLPFNSKKLIINSTL
jgi:hypothetical protein